MECPSCGHTSESLRVDREASSSTHNASLTSYHIPFPDWLKQLDQAVQSAWPKRFVGYTKVAVLMLCWETTYRGAMRAENRRLASVFNDVYNYSVSRWWIPSVDPDRAIYKRMDRFLDEYGHPENLLIIYYAGHARHNPAGGYFPIWQPRSEPEKGLQIDTATFHPLLVRAEDNSPDVLLLYDCCFSLASHRSNSNKSRAEVEGLFAGGFESKVPIPGQDSFTKHLTDALATAPDSGRTLTVAELHRQIIVRLQSFHEQAIFDANHEIRRCGTTGRVLHTQSVRVTPSHLFLAGNEKPRLIALQPLDESKPSSTTPEVAQAQPSNWPKVLLAIRLLDDGYIEQEFRDWILHAPPGVVEFRGIFPSFSSLLLIEVPIEVWDLLPPCPAVFFVSFTANPVQPNLRSPPDRPESSNSRTVLSTQSSAFTNQDTEEPISKSKQWDEDDLLEQVSTVEPDHEQATTPPLFRPQSPMISSASFKLPLNTRSNLFSAKTPRERTLVYLLDRADTYIHEMIREWRALPTREGLHREDWFLRHFNIRLVQESKETKNQFSAELFREHQDFVSRYLSTHEFLSHDNPMINITSRLNPLFTWKFEGAEPPYGSVTDPTTMTSSFWSSQLGTNTRAEDARSQGSYAFEERLDLAYNYDALGSNHPETSLGYPMPPELPPLDTNEDIIRGGTAAVETHDTRFSVEPGYKYQPGEVFKILWSEPTGTVDGPITEAAAYDKEGGFYVGFRSFIIVSTDESDHSTCVPILTYNGRGCAKRGVKPSKHGIAYVAGQKPRLLKHEPSLGFRPVSIEIYAEGETLARESRVNYSKLVTIEHNVKVCFIGRVPYADFQMVSEAVDACWSRKITSKPKKR
ncbi:hypothetical protein F4802DRAFT_545495 [Xylaria palmicola]|nr:hypothetical protein F4802DRAFT_545495 [Xylaria palmicola]